MMFGAFYREQVMEADLKALFGDVVTQQTLGKAQRRKAAAEALIQNPDILENLASDLSSTFEQVQQETRPLQEASPDSESHWTSRLHPDWTAEKLEALEELEIEYLQRAPALSPQDLVDIGRET